MPVVDGNVERVVARYFAGDRTKREARDAMASWIPVDAPGDFNQALMELGATICTPRSPHCLACPVRKGCDAHAAGDAEALPIKPKKTKQKAIRAVAAWIERGGRVLVVKRPEQGLMAGLWELPGGSIEARDEAKERVGEVLRRDRGARARPHAGDDRRVEDARRAAAGGQPPGSEDGQLSEQLASAHPGKILTAPDRVESSCESCTHRTTTRGIRG